MTSAKRRRGREADSGSRRSWPKARALSKKVVRVEWSLKRAPSTCRAAGLILSIGHYPQRSGDEWLPKTVFVATHGRLTGSTRIDWVPSAAQPADVALASATCATVQEVARFGF